MKVFHDLVSLKDVYSQILAWNYEPIEGAGLRSDPEKYAHIAIKIYTSDYYTDQVLWTVKEEYIPANFHEEIESVLTFFANYLLAIKGRRERNLVFEIIDGSFNDNSYRWAFTRATVRCLINCFDKELYGVGEFYADMIANAKKNGPRILKHERPG